MNNSAYRKDNWKIAIPDLDTTSLGNHKIPFFDPPGDEIAKATMSLFICLAVYLAVNAFPSILSIWSSHTKPWRAIFCLTFDSEFDNTTVSPTSIVSKKSLKEYYLGLYEHEGMDMHEL